MEQKQQGEDFQEGSDQVSRLVTDKRENGISKYTSKVSSNGSTPSIQRLSRSQPLSAFVEALERDGCVIVKDFTDIPTLEKADDEVRPILEAQSTGAKVGGKSV